MTIKDILAFFGDVHVRVALAFIVAFVGYTFPQYQVLCNLLAGYLGTTVVVTGAKTIAATLPK